MAESTLTSLYEDIANEISFMLYGNALYTTLDTAQKLNLTNIVKKGYKQFLYPPAVPGLEDGFEWSFMNPWTTLDLIASYDTGTVGISSNTVTLDSGIWPDWAATHGILMIDGTEITISSRDSNTELTSSGASDVTAGETDWQIEHNGDYDLPDDFGRLIDGYHFSRDDQKPSILGGVGEDKIKRLRNENDTISEPRVAAEVIKAAGAITGQRKEVQFWPRCNTAYTLHYKYAAFVGEFAAGEYPAGSMQFSETLTESCLAAAEIRMNDAKGPHWDLFASNLVSASKRDIKQLPKFVGNVGRKGDATWRGDTINNYKLQVGDTIIQS